MKKWVKLLLCIILVQLIAFLGSVFTVSSIETWYDSLIKPSFNPPSWLFGPVWTILYLMIGVSLYFFITSNPKKNYAEKNKIKKIGYWIFGIQILLNGIWTPLFFGLHNIPAALIVIIFLWLSIIANIFAFYKISKISAYLLVPYLIWVSFASVLNFSFWLLNG